MGDPAAMITLTSSFGNVPGGGEEIPGVGEETIEPFLPLVVAEAGGHFLERSLPELMFEERLQGVTAGKGQATGGEVTDHEELPGATGFRFWGGVVKPEGELFQRASRLQADKAEGDIYLGSALAELPIVLFQVLLDPGGKNTRGVDDQGKRWGCKGKRLLAFRKIEPATRAGLRHILQIQLAVGTG